MVCYSNDTKLKAQKFVMLVSIKLFVLGLLTIAFAYLKSSGEIVDTDYTKFKVD